MRIVRGMLLKGNGICPRSAPGPWPIVARRALVVTVAVAVWFYRETLD